MSNTKSVGNTKTTEGRTPARLLAGIVVSGGIALEAAPALAEPQYNVMRQITNITTGTIENARMRMMDGQEIVFVSNGDVMGPGTQTATRQIYLWQEQESGFGTIRQITNDETCESYGAVRPTDSVFSDRPKMFAFVSTCDLDPVRDNTDGNPEIFFYDIDNERFHQVTDTAPPVVNAEPFTSDSGLCLVFRSNGNLDNNLPANPNYDNKHPGPGFSNPDLSDEVFLYGKINGGFTFPHNTVFTQVSNGPAGTTSSKPVIGGYWFPRQCQTTVFQSNHDQFGNGHVGEGLYVYKMPSSAQEEMTAAEIPWGFPHGDYTNPMISAASPFARGPHIVFEGQPDLWNNGSLGTDVFNWRDFHPRMTQYTNVGQGFAAREPQVGDGGGVIVFSSDGELLAPRALRSGEQPPFNADANSEIFRLKGRKRVSQITQTTGCQNLHPTLKDDGKRLAFISDCDILPGENAQNVEQVFVWALVKHDSPLVSPGVCVHEDGCCLNTPRETTCYRALSGSKPGFPRPNCLDRPQGCD